MKPLEVIVAICAILVLIAIFWPTRIGRQPPRAPRDATQLSQLHKSIHTFGNQFGGIYPRPSLLEGHEFDTDTTANLYSMLIAQNYITPQLVVSPQEKNPNVTPKNDYDQDAYDPVHGVYWDETFVADLETGSNVSYAHIPIHSERRDKHWRANLDSSIALLSERGPKDGAKDPSSYTTDRAGDWSGHVVFGDGHVRPFNTTTHPDSRCIDDAGALQPDNMFKNESTFDIWLTFTQRIEGDEIVVQFD